MELADFNENKENLIQVMELVECHVTKKDGDDNNLNAR
jgi:hypothetical protein